MRWCRRLVHDAFFFSDPQEDFTYELVAGSYDFFSEAVHPFSALLFFAPILSPADRGLLAFGFFLADWARAI